MMNGTRCIKCGNYVYARSISGDIEPAEYMCDACRVRRGVKTRTRNTNKDRNSSSEREDSQMTVVR
ncbi:MAG: hypothetical protein SXQ77_01475 [Halobacteria archaeon]|nr:hypothetical protein [Halobacteria archaeon]